MADAMPFNVPVNPIGARRAHSSAGVAQAKEF